jgi:hypothetical protein
LGLLAQDEGFAGLPLSVRRIEALLQSLLGRLAGVDGAGEWGHVRRPKNKGPDHRVPVIE